MFMSLLDLVDDVMTLLGSPALQVRGPETGCPHGPSDAHTLALQGHIQVSVQGPSSPCPCSQPETCAQEDPAETNWGTEGGVHGVIRLHPSPYPTTHPAPGPPQLFNIYPRLGALLQLHRPLLRKIEQVRTILRASLRARAAPDSVNSYMDALIHKGQVWSAPIARGAGSPLS